MNVTKDVVIDLLPAYLSGESSADTRALVEEMAAREPAIARLLDAARRVEGESSLAKPAALPPNLERETVRRTRATLRGRSWALSMATVFTLAPFSFSFPAEHITMRFIRDPSWRLFWIAAAGLWFAYWRLGRRLQMNRS